MTTSLALTTAYLRKMADITTKTTISMHRLTHDKTQEILTAYLQYELEDGLYYLRAEPPLDTSRDEQLHNFHCSLFIYRFVDAQNMERHVAPIG